jgi:hypothetical protein
MISLHHDRESDKERGVRQALEARLNQGEQLAAYTTGKIFGVTAPAYHIGLTGERLVLLPLKRGAPAAQAYGIRRDRVKSVKLKWSGLFSSRLEVKLPTDRLDFTIQGGPWRKQALSLANGVTPPGSVPASDAFVTGSQHLQQAVDFQALGLTGLAQAELRAAEQANIVLGAPPAALQSLKAQLAETRLASRVAAGFLFGHVGLIVLLTGFFAVFGGSVALSEFWNLDVFVSVVVALWLGVQLWRGQRQARLATIYAAFVGFVFFGVLPLLSGDWVSLISQAAFNGSLLLVLTGPSKHGRTWAALVLYAIGYWGVVALSFIIVVVATLVDSF